ncbi:Tetratricopeptide repeat protein like, partial [Quillaja saponaria]
VNLIKLAIFLLPVFSIQRHQKGSKSLQSVMKSQQGQHPNYTITNAFTTDKQLPPTPTCTKPSCFFCTMTETDSSTRQAKIAQCFKEMPVRDDKEHVLVLSGLWKIAVTKPNDPEFPSLGIFDCMAKLIHRGVRDKDWLLRHQNIYIPYYAAHIIGSYTMNKAKFANKAVQSGVVLPLMHLLRGKISWVEQRVAIRALGHLASHEKTFEAIAAHETEIIDVATRIASSCLGEVYDKFVRVKESKRLKYHRNLITRGLGGLDFENRKAEEWASQLQCWSLFFLDCFARKGRALKLICKKDFLQVLCGMRGGLENSNSPGGIGLLRALCGTKTGRESIADLEEVLESICNVSRSSDDCQYIAIDCLLLLLKDPDTRYKVINIAAPVLVDLVEIRSIRRKAKVGQAITQCLLQDYHKVKYCKLNLKSQRAQEALEEIWDLKVEKEKRETLMSEEEIREKEVLASLLKQEGNKKFWAGDIEKAVLKYSEALGLCPLKFKKERIVLHSNKAQCHLLLRDPEAAISDTTRALCLSSLVNPSYQEPVEKITSL